MALGKELIGNLNSRLEIAACIATQVDDQIRETFLRQFGQGNEQLGIGILAEILHANIAALIVEHIAGRHTLGRYLTTRNSDMSHSLLAIADDAELYLCVLRSLQTVHGFFVRHFLSDKHGVVNLDNLVASQHTSPLCRAVANDVLNTNRILTNRKLNTDTGERATQVIVGNLPFTSRDIDGVRVEFGQNLWHGFLHQVVYIDRIDILVIDNVEQVVELVATRVDNVQAVTREMIGIEGTNQDTYDHRDSQPKWHKTIVLTFHRPLFISINIHKYDLDTSTLQQVDTVGETILLTIHHTADPSLYNQLGTLDTRRGRDVNRRAVAVVVATCQLRDGIGLCMEYIGLGDIIVVLAHILKTTRRTVIAVADDHLVLHHQGTDLTALAVGILCPNARHTQVALIQFLLFLVHFLNHFLFFLIPLRLSSASMVGSPPRKRL